MKKYLTLLIIGSFLLSGCESSTTFDKSSVVAEITLYRKYDGLSQDLFKEYISEFNKEYPNIKVNSEMGSEVIENVADTVISKENKPDIVIGNKVECAKLVEESFACDMTSLIDDKVHGLDKEDFFSWYLESGQTYVKKGTYSLPYSNNSFVMYWNEDFLKGLDLSSFDSSINKGNPIDEGYIDNLTWEELFNKLCPALKRYNDSLSESEKILKGEVNSFVSLDYEEDLFINLAKQYGSGYLSFKEGNLSCDFNNAKMKEVLKTFNDAYKKGYFLSKGKTGMYSNRSFTNHNSLFAISLNSSYKMFSNSSFNVSVSRIPYKEGGNEEVYNFDSSFVFIDNKDENKLLASYLFYKFLFDKDNEISVLNNTISTPCRKSTYKSQEYLDCCDISSKKDRSPEILLAKKMKLDRVISEEKFNSISYSKATSVEPIIKNLFISAAYEENLTDEKLNSLFDVSIDSISKIENL